MKVDNELHLMYNIFTYFYFVSYNIKLSFKNFTFKIELPLR